MNLKHSWASIENSYSQKDHKITYLLMFPLRWGKIPESSLWGKAKIVSCCPWRKILGNRQGRHWHYTVSTETVRWSKGYKPEIGYHKLQYPTIKITTVQWIHASLQSPWKYRETGTARWLRGGFPWKLNGGPKGEQIPPGPDEPLSAVGVDRHRWRRIIISISNNYWALLMFQKMCQMLYIYYII